MKAAPFPRHFGIHRPSKGRPLFWEYEDLPVEAEEFWGFRYNRKRRITGIRLDTIQVAGVLLLTLIITILEGSGLPWAAIVAEALNPEANAQHWCGWKGTGVPFPPEDRAKTNTHEDHLADLHTLTSWEVLEKVAVRNRGNRMFFSFFKVLKSCQTRTRAIANCKVLGKYFAPPPPMRLITPLDLFNLMAYFPRPWFFDLDFRHWFYQIPLPNNVRKWFSTTCGDECFQLKVWPMGFKWTPAVAQGITMIITAQACRRAGFQYRSPLPDDTEIPPYWLVFRKESDTKPIAFLVAYYDNILCIANSKPVRDALRAAVAAECKRVKAVIKVTEPPPRQETGDTQPPSTETQRERQEEAGIREWDEGEVSFLGVHFTRKGSQVWWRHADGEKWRHLNPWDPCLTRAGVAEIVGVVIWHWTLTNTKLVTIRLVLAIASTIGKLCTTKKDWDIQADLAGDQRAALMAALEEVFLACKEDQLFNFEPTRFHDIFFAASDSSKDRGAAMYFHVPFDAILDDEMWSEWLRTQNHLNDSYRSWWWPWNEVELGLSINRKEIWAALEVVDLVILWKEQANTNRKWLVPIAIDNTTATSALSTWYFPADEEMAEELEQRHEKCEALNIVILPVQVKSEEEAADDNTRGRVSSASRRALSLSRLRWALLDLGMTPIL